MASNDGSPVVSSKNPSPEKRKGISRKKKSASQTEVLEKAYAVEKYPCEATRSRLTRELDLTEKQLQIWFTHRRYKDRRDGIDDEELISKARGSKHDHIHHEDPRASKKREIDLNSREGEDSEDGHPARVLAEEHYDEEFMGDNPNGLDVSGGEDEPAKPKLKPTPRRRPGPRVPRDPNMPPRKPGPKPKMDAAAAAERVAILAIERQLGGPLRDDGPPLGFEFDPLPPDAFQQPAYTEAPHSAGGYREGESENSDRDGRESKGNGDYQWRNGLMEKKKKIGHFPKPSREGVY